MGSIRQYFGGALRWQTTHAGVVASEVQYDAAKKCSPHTHKNAFFSLLLCGHYAERYWRARLDYVPFDIGFHPEATDHADETGENSRVLIIELESKWIARLREYSPGADLTPHICKGQASGLAARLHSERWNETVLPLLTEGIALELLATLAPIRSSERRPPNWIVTAREVLEAEPARRHTIDGLARCLDLHPVYMARTFRKFLGESPAQYLMRVRIRVAMNKLANSQTSISEIALLTGFSDQSHLTRAMNRHTGMTPAAFRASVIRGYSPG